VLENRVLRGIFGPKMGKVAGWCRELGSQKRRNFYVGVKILIST
jgi:hypothetical protein